MEANSGKAFAGVKVLEWADFVAGPYCAKLLADLGAEVIKIEKPGRGDDARHRGPYVHDKPNPEGSLLFLNLNTNKLGVTLDIESSSGREQFIKLVRWADILIEDNLPQELERLGLTYAELARVNPGLVMTSITPFGQTGPYRNYKAYPLNVYHSGMGRFGPRVPDVGLPLKHGAHFSEYAAGLIAGVGMLAALYHRRVTGLGQQVDVSKQEALLSLARVQAARYPNEGVEQVSFPANGSGVRRGPAWVFQCRDGYVTKVNNRPNEWQALVNLITDSKIEGYEQYLDEDYRRQHAEEIDRHVAGWMKNYTMDAIYHRGQALGLPVGPVMTAKDVAESPQSGARQLFIEADHPVAGRLKYPAAGYRLSATPAAIERTAPLLGQHNQEVFSRLPTSGEPDAGDAGTAGQPPGEGREATPTALRGLRVADFAWLWAGSYATELLALLGTEDIKIESMRRIDPSRIGSITTGQEFDDVDSSSVFNDLNLGKLSIKLNLSQPKAVELVKELISRSDVVAQNMRPGVMDRLGLGYDALKEVKPDIIYLSSSARGATGPERGYSGYAPVFAALSGLSHITGVPDGEPCNLAGEIDLLSAVTSTFAILVAIHYRLSTGEGQYIDISSSDSVSVLIGEVLMDYLANGRVQMRRGNVDELMAPHNCYRCKGEKTWVSIAVATDEEWEAFCQVIGSPEWAKKARFETAAARWQNQAELDKQIEQWTSNYAPDAVMEMLQAAGVAAMTCFSDEELYNNPHLQQRQCWTKVVHPVLGEQVVLNPPWKLSATPATANAAAPLFGEHSNHVFKELLGLTDDELRQLEEERVLY